MACAKEKFDWDNNLKHVHDYDWLCEAVTMVMHIFSNLMLFMKFI